jgi:dihydropteroate synthase
MVRAHDVAATVEALKVATAVQAGVARESRDGCLWGS